MNRAGKVGGGGSTAYFQPQKFFCLSLLSQWLHSLAESLLGGVDDVEEAVLVLLLAVEVRHRSGDGGQRGPVHQQEEGLVRVQLKSAPESKHFDIGVINPCEFLSSCLSPNPFNFPSNMKQASSNQPDDVLQLADRDVVRDEELGLVEDGQLLLAVVPLNDDWHLGGVLLPDLLHVLHAEG